KRLVYQVLDHILAADIDDESDLWFEGSNICEVLLGPNAQIHTAGLELPMQQGNDRLISGFIGKEIVRSKVTVGFGEIDDRLPEFAVAQPRRKCVCSIRRSAGYVSE